MTEIEYRSHPAISRSELWKLRESPEKFRWYMDHPQEPTPALLFGQTVHKLLLQPDTFSDEFAVAPNVDRRTKGGREEYNSFLEAAGSKTVITGEDYQRAIAMVDKCLSEPFMEQLISGEHEVPFFWTDELTGENCKCRADAIAEIGDNLVIVDYKTTTDASTDTFMREAMKWGYGFQAAMYSEGVEKNTGRKPLFVFIAQEKTEPYAVNILQADPAFIGNGYDIFRELLGIYHYCKINNVWYGYTGKENIINTLSLPAWMKGE